VVIAKGLINPYIKESEFKAFKKDFIQVNKVLSNMIDDKEYSEEYLKKSFNGKIIEMSIIDNGSISQNNILNISSSYLVSPSPGTFSRVKDTLLSINLKGKFMTILISNIDISKSSTDVKGTFDLAKEFAAQFIAINSGEIEIIQ